MKQEQYTYAVAKAGNILPTALQLKQVYNNE